MARPPSPTWRTHAWTARRRQDHRARGDRAGALLRHDAGGHGRRRDPRRPRPERDGRRPGGAAGRRAQPGPPLDRASTSRTPTAWRRCSTLVESADAPDRGLPARRDGAPRPRPRRVPRPQPEARLRPHDGLGPGRARTPRPPATTSTTSRSPARSSRSAAAARRRCRRSTWSATSAAAACCSRSASCAALLERQQHRRGPGGRRGHGRRRRHAHDDVLRLPRHGHVERRAGHQHARHRRALLRRLRDAPTASTCRSARSSRSSTPSCSASPGSTARSCPGSTTATQWPALKERLAAIFKAKTRDEWCEIMEGTDVCFAPVLSLTEAPEHPHNVAARDVHRGRRRRPAGAGAPLLAHPGRHPAARPPTPASTPTRCWPSGASTPTGSPSSARPAPSPEVGR